MMFSKKKEIKLSLIDDYIKIVIAKNFINNSFKNSIKNNINFKKVKDLTENLEIAYLLIFEKLKLNDLSLLILKKELKLNNSLYTIEKTKDFKNINSTLDSMFRTLNNINNNLNYKLSSL